MRMILIIKILNRRINLFVSVSDNIPLTARSMVNFGRQSATFFILKNDLVFLGEQYNA
jgi:hypothetical protein